LLSGEIFLDEQPVPASAALRDFTRFDVLLPELGHHVLQHRAGRSAACNAAPTMNGSPRRLLPAGSPTVQAALSRTRP
jgi:hypothetical protein